MTMIAFALFALFAAIAIASAIVLADSGLRGFNAFRRLQGELAAQAADGADTGDIRRPRQNPVSPGGVRYRPGQVRPLRAAA